MSLSFTTRTLKSGDTIETSQSFSSEDIPSDWRCKAVLARPLPGTTAEKGERFGFYRLPDGRIAEIMFHPMNGKENLFARIGTREFMGARYEELLEGELYETRECGPMGTVDRRCGRLAKAQRVA